MLGFTFYCLSSIYAISSSQEGPSVLSPNFGGVNYTLEKKHQWILVFADEIPVVKAWINGKEQNITPDKTITHKISLNLKEGKNTYLVEAENEKGIKTQREFTFFHHPDSQVLDTLKQDQLPPEDRSHVYLVNAGIGQKMDSNGAHLSDDTKDALDISDSDLQANIRQLEFGFGYRLGKTNEKNVYRVQYAYLREDFPDKKAGDLDYTELSTQSHNIMLQWERKFEKSALSATYLFSSFSGNANKDDVEDSTTDNGDDAYFHFFMPNFIYVHNPRISSMFSIQFAIKQFEKEPEDKESDRDSISPGGYYSLFYYLPSNMGRIRGIVGYLQENAQGEWQKYTATSFGLNYERTWQVKPKHDIKLLLGTENRNSIYDNKNPNLANADDNEENSGIRKETSKNKSSVGVSWIYNSTLTISIAYSSITTDSNADDYSFDSQVLGLNAAFNTVF